MNTTQAFENTIKDFLSSNVLVPLAQTAVENKDLGVDELVKVFTEKLSLPLVVPQAKGTTRRRSPKSSSPKAEQQWLTYDQYNEQVSSSFLCGYVQTRGKYKDHYCGVCLDNESVVSWSKESGFTQSTPENELKEVNGKRSEMRCKLCWARDPKTGEYKRKKGRGDKLVSEHKGDIVAPTVIPGVSVPDNESLMGFLSGNSKTFVSPTRALETAKKVIRAKRYKGLIRNEDYSHVMPNPEHHDMPWLIRADSDGQVVIGKFERQPTPTTVFEEDYLEELVPLDEQDVEKCKEYNIEYKPYQKPVEEDMDIDIPIVHEREDDTTTIQDIPDVPTLEIDDMLNNLNI
jgi:hypothetical protein